MAVVAPTPLGGAYPAPGRPPSRAEFDAFVSTLATWLNDRGDRLVHLDERAALHATERQRSDVAIGFVVWQAIGTRRDEVVGVPWVGSAGPTAAADLVWAPITDRSGAPLAANLPEAVALVDELLAQVGRALDGTESTSQARFEQQVAIDADLDVAERLSQALGDQVRATAELRRALDRLTLTASTDPSGAELDDAAVETLRRDAARLRADLEHIDAERTAALARLAEVRSTGLDHLRVLESDARAAVADSAEIVVSPPRLAVPSVDAIDVPGADVVDLPWPQARPIVTAFVEKVDRVERALDTVIAANRAPRRERDDLRGLLQAYRQKAAAQGQAERADVDEAYRGARAVLWSAPCDLVEARRLVDDYQRLVLRGAAGPTDALTDTSDAQEDRR